MALTREQQDEIMRAAKENRARQEAMLRDREEGVPEINLILLCSESDPAQFSDEVQTELRKIRDALSKSGIVADMPVMMMDAADASGGYVGQIVVQAKQMGPVIASAVAAWLHGRYGRKITIEFFTSGKPKRIEAQTMEQVDALIKLAREEAEPRPK